MISSPNRLEDARAQELCHSFLASRRAKLLRERPEIVHFVYELNALEQLGGQSRWGQASAAVEVLLQHLERPVLALRKLLHEEDLEEEKSQTRARSLERLLEPPLAHGALLKVREAGQAGALWLRLELPDHEAGEELVDYRTPHVNPSFGGVQNDWSWLGGGS